MSIFNDIHIVSSCMIAYDILYFQKRVYSIMSFAYSSDIQPANNGIVMCDCIE